MSPTPILVMIRSFEVRKTRNNDNFGSLRINLGLPRDFAEVEAKIWGLDQHFPAGGPLPAPGDLLEVIEHKEDEYQGRPQWILRAMRLLSPAERERALADFVPPVQIDKDFYKRRLDALIESTDARRACGQLLREIFDSAGFREAFYAAPAAIRHHQSYPGGLLEHTINVTSVAMSIAEIYARAGEHRLSFNSQAMSIDREVLIAAGLLHDIGKMDTYRMNPLAETTDQQNWEGHLAISYAMVRARAEPLMANPPYPGASDEIGRLLHCILSHHGKLEFGSPVEPACAEAFILSQADLTDARLAEIAEGVFRVRQQDPQARWLPRNLHFPSGVFIADWANESGEDESDG